MIQKINRYCNERYTYSRFTMDEVTVPLLRLMIGNIMSQAQVGTGKHAYMVREIYCGFDIETYSMSKRKACMYVWQFSIGRSVIKGRTWADFVRLLGLLETAYQLDKKHRLIVWVANLGYEWQWMRRYLHVTDYFFKNQRNPLYIQHADCIDFRECLTISGGSLKYLAKTYTNTQKAIETGFDYKKPRHSFTPLTDLEEDYCDNDVLVLTEWSEYIFNTYIRPQHYIPLTMQSIIRKKIHKACVNWWHELGHDDTKELLATLRELQPTEGQYQLMSRWVFRGGFVHGNVRHIGEEIYRPGSLDETSEYPNAMINDYVPGKFKKDKNIHTIEDILHTSRIKKQCVIAVITFHDIRARWDHSIESKSKCIALDSPIIDNGRIRCARSMTVALTELDLELYLKFYSWDSAVVQGAMTARRIYLPSYVVKPMCEDYKLKHDLKARGEDYAVPKAFANSYYGVICQKLNTSEVVLSEDGELEEGPAKPYLEQIRKRELLFQWAIYITAQARYDVLSTIYTLTKCGYTVYYSDTDSIKVDNPDACMWVFEQYNKRKQAQVRKTCRRLRLNLSVFWDIGSFDNEGKYFKYKYLGAKRYIGTKLSKKGTIELQQTIAGLPKDALKNTYSTHQECFDAFHDGMVVHCSGKLTSHYIDEPIDFEVEDYLGNIAVVHEESAISLMPSDFTLNMDSAWLNMVESIQRDNAGKEDRG